VALLDQENCIARLRIIAEQLSASSQGDPQAILAQVLEADPYSMEFHRLLVELEDLGMRARQQLEELAEDPSYDQFDELINRILAILEQLNMREDGGMYAAPFNREALTLLGVCDRAFQRLLTTKYRSAGTIPDEQVLKDALAEIREASDSIEHLTSNLKLNSFWMRYCGRQKMRFECTKFLALPAYVAQLNVSLARLWSTMTYLNNPAIKAL
jgi:hypothetical protein